MVLYIRISECMDFEYDKIGVESSSLDCKSDEMVRRAVPLQDSM